MHEPRRSNLWRPWTTGVLSLAAVLACGLEVQAQQQGPGLPSARLFTVMPMGGKIGTTVEVTVGGADLDEVTGLYFSHPGLKAERVPDAAKPGSFVANKFNVTIAANAPLGCQDVRAITRWGLSNPRAFVVGDLTEVLEKEPNNDLPVAHKIDLDTTINAAISANVDTDYFSFTGKAGQRVVIVCQAAGIDSRLNPFMQLFDAGNRALASSLRYRNRDALLDATLPANGDYFIRVSEHAYLAGSAEYFYRLTLTQAPWIDSAFPPVVEIGKPTQVTLYGRNLPNGQLEPASSDGTRIYEKAVVTVTAPADPMSRQRMTYSGAVEPAATGTDGFEYRVKNAAGTSNPVLLTFATAPVLLDNGNNDTSDRAQEIKVPSEICGLIEKPYDRDWFVFSAKQGDVFSLEAYADRIGSPIDLYFELRRADNKQSLGEFDDLPNTEILSATKFFSMSYDPKTRFTAPADGVYELQVASRSDLQSGPRFFYRLCIRKEQPDFRLVLVDAHDNNPEACAVRQGSSQYLQVLCFRNDGFNGEVTISAEGLPPGVTCLPQTLGPNQRQTFLVLTAQADAPIWDGEIRIKGTTTINGAPVVREARGGCIVWPTQQGQNIPAISRMSRTVCLSIREKGPFGLETDIKEIAVPLGGNVAGKVKIARHWPEFKAAVQLTAISVPPPSQGNPPAPPQVTLAADKPDAEFRITVPSNATPGVYNLVLRGVGQVPFNKDPKAAQKPNINVVVPSTPIKVTVYNSVADVTVNNPNLTIKAGTDAELIVKVTRKYDYKGELKVQLVLPQGFAGVTAQEVTIPAGASEAKLMLKSPANANAATNPNVLVRATATVNNVALTQEAKLAVTITK
jgi:hypothetical protein